MPEPEGTADDEDEDRQHPKPWHHPERWWPQVRWLLVVAEPVLGLIDHKATTLAAIAARVVVKVGDRLFRP